jgi:hypothetical protein
MGKVDYDYRQPGNGRGGLVLQHHSFDETMVFLPDGSRQAQFAPPRIDQRGGDVVPPGNLRNARARRKSLFQNTPLFLGTPASAAFRPAENRDPSHKHHS